MTRRTRAVALPSLRTALLRKDIRRSKIMQAVSFPPLDCSFVAYTTGATLRDTPCRAHFGEDRIQAIDHRDDFLSRDIERRHETQRIRPRRVEQHAVVKRLRDDRRGDRK